MKGAWLPVKVLNFSHLFLRLAVEKLSKGIDVSFQFTRGKRSFKLWGGNTLKLLSIIAPICTCW